MAGEVINRASLHEKAVKAAPAIDHRNRYNEEQAAKRAARKEAAKKSRSGPVSTTQMNQMLWQYVKQTLASKDNSYSVFEIDGEYVVLR